MPSLREVIAKPIAWLSKAVEGQPRGGPWLLPVSHGWLPANVGDKWNWWQLGYDVLPYLPSAVVEACVAAYSQTVAMCPGDHWLSDGKGGRNRITTSDLHRIVVKPNFYQSISDFLLNEVRSLYLDGNAYALAQRNDRFEVAALHPMDSRLSKGAVSENGEVFYHLGGNEIVDRMLDSFGTQWREHGLWVPARDVLHVKLNVDQSRDMLTGVSPLWALARDMALTDAAAQQQLEFYQNKARPGAVLATDMVLTKEQVETIRLRWEEQSRGLGAGGTPILTQGLKPVAMPQQTAEDMQLANMMKLTDQRIAMAFRVPLAILGIGGATAGSTEALMQQWIATGLGFCLNHLEEAWGNFFKLDGQPDEYLEFDTRALLRSAFQTRVEGYARGVQGGIFSPNEARAEFEMTGVEAGEEPRVQQQVVPLSAANAIPAAPPAPGAPPSAGQPAAFGPQKGMTDAPDNEILKRRFRSTQSTHATHAL